MIRRRTLAVAAVAAAIAPASAQSGPAPTVALPGGGTAPALGQGSWRLGQGRRPAAEEEEALRTGLALGMTCLDTAEMYGDGQSESLIAWVLAGQRDKAFLVSKVLPSHAGTERSIRDACLASLTRLGTDHLDLYLLHWRSGRALNPVVAAFGALQREDRIRRWGVSNFGVSDLEELVALPGGSACAANQILYNLRDRQAERDVVPWCVRRGIPIMAYSPLGSSNPVLGDPTLNGVAERHGVTAAAVAVAWTMRNGCTISIPESGSVAHVRENAKALTLRLDEADILELDRAFPT